MNSYEIINSIQQWAMKNSDVRSVFLLGSHGRGDYIGLSDIDLAIESVISQEIFLAEISDLIPVQNHQCWDSGKMVLWVGPTFVKVDCFLVRDASELSRYYWTSRLPTNNEWILLDRTENLASRLLSTEPTESKHDDVIWLNKRFVNQLEAASKHHSRSDTFRYMFAMQIAYDSLIRMACHLSGNTDSIYLPKAGHVVLEKLLPHWISKHFGTEGNLRTANQRKQNLFNAWKDLQQLARDRDFNLGYSETDELFLENIMARDHFWNFRDIGDGADIEVNRGLIYRGACLIPHIDEVELNEKIEQTGIKWVVDLRSEREQTEKPYPSDFPIQVLSCPTWNVLERPDSWPQRQPEWHNDYPGNLSSMAPYIPQILTLVSSGEPGYIHCYAGRDRTGVICTLILRMLGCGSEELHRAYGLSSTPDFDAISIIIDWFECPIRFRAVLDDLNIGERLITGVRNALLPELQAGGAL